ncbi:histidine kinase [Clostridium butyricum]|uniref:histidine kinase n=1 Tax=Clostridium butyricum TaxID=1492 RepID=UPI00168B229A|nr:histidine kinase [Clostridium butyricum]MBS5984532.1 histidine kinase [Clostridium butyricum]
METLLTVNDLSKRWQKDERTIRKYIADGTITACKGVPGVMFHPKYIAELEGIEFEKFTQLERKKMQNENNALKKENEELKSLLREYQTINLKSLAILTA